MARSSRPPARHEREEWGPLPFIYASRGEGDSVEGKIENLDRGGRREGIISSVTVPRRSLFLPLISFRCSCSPARMKRITGALVAASLGAAIASSSLDAVLDLVSFRGESDFVGGWGFRLPGD